MKRIDPTYAAEMIPYWRDQARQYEYRIAHPDSWLPSESTEINRRDAARCTQIADAMEAGFDPF